MLEQLGKLIATGLVWVLCAGITITALITNQNNTDGFQTIIFTVVPLVTALATTFMIWVAPELVRNDREEVRRDRVENASSKAKRNAADGEAARLATLMDMMDEDERHAFKESLKRRVMREQQLNDDGEFYSDQTTLDSLLQDDYDDKQLRH